MATKKEPTIRMGSLTVVDTQDGLSILFDSDRKMFTVAKAGTWPKDRRYDTWARRRWSGSIRGAYAMLDKERDAQRNVADVPVVGRIDGLTDDVETYGIGSASYVNGRLSVTQNMRYVRVQAAPAAKIRATVKAVNAAAAKYNAAKKALDAMTMSFHTGALHAVNTKAARKR